MRATATDRSGENRSGCTPITPSTCATRARYRVDRRLRVLATSAKTIWASSPCCCGKSFGHQVVGRLRVGAGERAPVRVAAGERAADRDRDHGEHDPEAHDEPPTTERETGN